ncbi:MAG: M24 family metallopeptidase [Acidimicrobiia bacterium]|nr:M24 family metallopeptidase [Acidimicrobiia bacterium]
MNDADNRPVADHPFPRFSDQELARRRRAVHDLMEEAGVGHLLVYGSDRSGSAVPWLSEWPVTREAALVITPNGDDHLLIQHYNHLPNARRVARGVEVDWAGPSTMSRVAQLLPAAADQGIGVIGPLRARDHQLLSESVGELVYLDAQYTRLRLVKSDEEIERLREAARFSDLSVAAIIDQLEPGMTERELAAIVEGSYLAEGATNHIHYFATTPMASPDTCVPAQFQSTRRIEVGDILFCEISAAYWGYAGQILRTFIIGADPTPLFVELHDVADDAYDAILSVIRPGVHARDLVNASAVIEERGFTTYDDLVHGYGGGYLPPVLGSSSRPNLPVPDLHLEQGMALVVQPNVITPDQRAGVQTGQLVVVTGSGADSLHNIDRGLGRIG